MSGDQNDYTKRKIVPNQVQAVKHEILIWYEWEAANCISPFTTTSNLCPNEVSSNITPLIGLISLSYYMNDYVNLVGILSDYFYPAYFEDFVWKVSARTCRATFWWTWMFGISNLWGWGWNCRNSNRSKWPLNDHENDHGTLFWSIADRRRDCRHNAPFGR